MMKILVRAICVSLTVLSFSATVGISGIAAQTVAKPTSTADFEKALSWLPENTETIAVAKGPFVPLHAWSAQEGDENGLISDRDLEEFFQAMPIGLFGFKNKLLIPRLDHRRVLLAVEGARHFRSPSGLGPARFEGCSIALLADDFDEDIDSFIKANRKEILSVQHIQGQAIAVLQEGLENDTWTFFLAFPDRRTLVVATDEGYLREVLARIGGKRGKRALPSDLPEWKFARTDSEFWGVRHFDRAQAREDPTSPFGGHLLAEAGDQQAIGLTFAYDPKKARQPVITYVSGNPSIEKNPEVTLLAIGRGSEAKQLNITYRGLGTGVVEATYTLTTVRSAGFFVFAFEAMIGHVLVI